MKKTEYNTPHIEIISVKTKYHILSGGSAGVFPVDPDDPGYDGPWDANEHWFEDFNEWDTDNWSI